MQIEKAIENIKLSKSTFLFGAEQTIVNIEDLDTVLNELERYKKLINRKNARLSEYAGDIAKRDKVINEMAGYIMYLDIDEDICMKNTTNTELCNEKYTNCRECIKEYFYKKAQK